MNCNRNAWKIGDNEFGSRLFVGTGKYRSFRKWRAAMKRREPKWIAVAVRRVNQADRSKESLLGASLTGRNFLLYNGVNVTTADKYPQELGWGAKWAYRTGEARSDRR